MSSEQYEKTGGYTRGSFIETWKEINKTYTPDE
jgi:hypothetical protein